MTPDERYPKRLEMIEVLSRDPMTAIELAAEVGQSPSRMRTHLNDLHAEKRVYVYDWKRTRGRTGAMSAIYKAGNRKDKPKPDWRESRREASRRHYATHRISISLRRRAKTGTLTPFSQLMCDTYQPRK